MDRATATIGRTVEKELFIKASVEQVFRAITDPVELGRWFGQQAEVDLRPGGALRFTWVPEGTEGGTVVAVEPPRRFVFQWGSKHVTEVAFVLTPHDDGTLLRLTETGFGAGDDWDRMYIENNRGWDKELGHLRTWVEEGNASA